MFKLLGVAVLALCAMSNEALAGSLLGQTVRITGEYGIGSVQVGPTDVVVGAGLEVPPFFWNIYAIDLSDTNILFTFPGTCCGGFTPGTFNGIHFYDLLGTIDDFTSVSIASSNVSGFNNSRISFDANNIYVNFQSLVPNQTTSAVSLNITTSAAPEPSAWLLMTGGAVTLIAMRRRKRLG